MPYTQADPVVTLYRHTGMVQCNKAATRLLQPTTHEHVDLLAPILPRHPWKLDRRLGSPSTLHYHFGRPARFRASHRLRLFFEHQPPTTQSVRLALSPDPAFPDLFLLTPLD
jgi:hypothetical protein